MPGTSGISQTPFSSEAGRGLQGLVCWTSMQIIRLSFARNKPRYHSHCAASSLDLRNLNKWRTFSNHRKKRAHSCGNGGFPNAPSTLGFGWAGFLLGRCFTNVIYALRVSQWLGASGYRAAFSCDPSENYGKSSLGQDAVIVFIRAMFTMQKLCETRQLEKSFWWLPSIRVIVFK